MKEEEKSNSDGKRLCSCVITAASQDAGDSTDGTDVECEW